MKDIDFDELDKAVNSLMGTAAGPAIKEDSAPASVEPKSDAPVAAPGPVPADPLTTPAPSPAPARPVMPAQRRSGRFMDMVHTSSDMTSSRPSQSPSREGLSVAPRTQPEAPTPTNPATEPTSASTDAPAWPDPLELASSQAPTEPVPTAETTSEPAVEPSAAPVEPEPSAQALDSPFLTNAKVEKRPLNAGTPTDETPAAEPVVPTDADETPKPFVPAELNSDLVAIESGEPKTDTPSVESVPTNQTEAVASPAPVGPTSIAQQYREEPNSGDQSHAAIYDTSQFQAPLAHPAKKKSGWLWIVWVLLLLALGAGGAVALYMADLI